MAFQDAFAITRTIFERATTYSIDGARIAIGGSSVGAGLAAAICQAARDGGGPAICFQLLVVPLVDFTYPRRTPDSMPSEEMLNLFRTSYFRNIEDAKDVRASPLLARDLSQLPPALVLTGEHDGLREQGELYAERLRQSGVHAKVVRCCGVAHVFLALGDRISVAAQALVRAAQTLRNIFEVLDHDASLRSRTDAPPLNR